MKKNSQKETLEEEIKEAVKEEKGHIGEGQKIAEQQQEINGINLKITSCEKKEVPEKIPLYRKKESPQKSVYLAEKPQTEYIENQEFYIKNENDFDKINDAMQRLKTQDSGMSRVDDSDLWILDPETKQLKIRRMPRTVLDMLKEKKVVLDYYKPI